MFTKVVRMAASQSPAVSSWVELAPIWGFLSENKGGGLEETLSEKPQRPSTHFHPRAMEQGYPGAQW